MRQHQTDTQNVIVGSDDYLPMKYRGSVTLKFKGKEYNLEGVLCVPDLKKNLMSIKKLSRNLNCVIVFNNKEL